MGKRALGQEAIAAASEAQTGPAPLMKSEVHQGRRHISHLPGLADQDDAANMVVMSIGHNSSTLEHSWDDARNLRDTWVGAMVLVVSVAIVFVFVNYAQTMPEKPVEKHEGKAQQLYIGDAGDHMNRASVSHAPMEGRGGWAAAAKWDVRLLKAERPLSRKLPEE